MSGRFSPAAAKMSTTSSEITARDTICRIARSSSSSLRRSPATPLASTARTAWKNATSSRIASASSCGTDERERLRQLGHGAQQPRLAVLERQHVLLRRRQQREPVLRPAAHPVRPVKPVEQPAAHLVLLLHQRHGLGLVDRGLPGPAALGVGRQRRLQLLGQAEVVDHQPARLVLEDAVDAGDRLHQPVPAHRLVDVHRVQRRRVEAGQPHVAHDDDLERVARVAEALGQLLATRLVADVLLPVELVGRGARHHHLERALAVALAVPRRPQLDDLAVQLDADPPAHAHDHRLAVHRRQAALEVVDEIARDQLHPVLRRRPPPRAVPTSF